METEAVGRASPLCSSRDHLGKHGIESGSIHNGTTSHPVDCATCHGHDGRFESDQVATTTSPTESVPLSGSGLFLPHSYLGTFLPQTTAVKICKLFPNSLERQDLNWKPDSEPFHLLLPHPSLSLSSTRSPTPHSPRRIPETVNLSAAVSRVPPQAPPQTPPQSSSNGTSQATFLPLCLRLPSPPPGKRSHHRLPVLERGMPCLQCHGCRDMAQPSGCCSLSRSWEQESLAERVDTLPLENSQAKRRPPARERGSTNLPP